MARTNQGGPVTKSLDLSRIERLPWYPKVVASLEEFDRLWGITMPYSMPLKVVQLQGTTDTGGYMPYKDRGAYIELSGVEVEHTIAHELGHWILHEMVGIPTHKQNRKLAVKDIWDKDVQAIIRASQDTGDRWKGGRALQRNAQGERVAEEIRYLAQPDEIFARVFEGATNHLVGRKQTGYGKYHDLTIFTNLEMERIISHVRTVLERFKQRED